MKKIFLTIPFFGVLALLLLSSCSNKAPDDPLIVPPNFAEIPDPKNPEQINDQQKIADIAKLKDLLLKSE